MVIYIYFFIDIGIYIFDLPRHSDTWIGRIVFIFVLRTACVFFFYVFMTIRIVFYRDTIFLNITGSLVIARVFGYRPGKMSSGRSFLLFLLRC